MVVHSLNVFGKFGILNETICILASIDIRSKFHNFLIMDEDPMVLYRKLANLATLDNKKDPLDILFRLTINPIKNKTAVFILKSIFCLFSFTFSITCYRLLSSFDTRVLIKHGSVGGVEFFILIIFGILLYNREKVVAFNDAYKKVVFSIDRDSVEKKEYETIIFKAKMMKLAATLIYALSLMATFGLISSPEYIRYKSGFEDWVLGNFPDYSNIIIFLYHMTFFPIAIVLVSFCVYAIYIAFSAMFQIVLMNGTIKYICKSKIPPMKRLECEIYQDIVHQKMKIFVLFQSLCFKTLLIGRELCYVPIIFVSIGIVILAGSLLLEVFANDVAMMNNRYGVVSFGLVGALSLGFYMVSGQLLKDESERTNFLLLQVPWYYMNMRNRKLYILMLMMSQKPISVSNGLIEVNYALLLQIVKTIYSMAALLLQFVDRTTAKVAEE